METESKKIIDGSRFSASLFLLDINAILPLEPFRMMVVGDLRNWTFYIVLLLIISSAETFTTPSPTQSTRIQRLALPRHHDGNSERVTTQPSRREFVDTNFVGMVTFLSGGMDPAWARGLVQFPCDEPLLNTYHFMRAGESLLEEQNIWSTNPLFVTNREAALSGTGFEQVESAVKYLRQNEISPSIIRYSIAASSTDTANLLGRELKVGRDRLIPEFNYLVPRAIGQWDMLDLKTTVEAVAAMDYLESGNQGTEGRPPPNDDGTPNETLADVAIRLRQLFSVFETQYSGDNILVVACDGITLALLSCMIAGVPYNQVHELNFLPGEVRLNVTKSSTLALLRERRQEQDRVQSFQAMITEGKKELQRLRGMDEIVSRKDLLLQAEQEAIDAKYKKQQEEKKRAQEESLRLQKERQDAIRMEAAAAREEKARQREQERLQKNAGALDNPYESSSSSGLETLAGGLGLLVASAALSTFVPDKSSARNITEDIAEPDAKEAKISKDGGKADIFSREIDAGSVVHNTKIELPVAISGMVEAPNTIATTANTNGELVGTVESVTLTMEDKKRAADLAMEEYLNKDDGGEDWLNSLSEIIADDEENAP